MERNREVYFSRTTPPSQNVQFQVLLITDKALYSLGPGYLKDCITPYEPSQLLRSSGESLLLVLPASEACLVRTKEPSQWLLCCPGPLPPLPEKEGKDLPFRAGF